jgi:asparagine synthase (glutamine-hydrolysing)
MSVQAGILNFDERPIDDQLLTTIKLGLEDYGPDGEHAFVDGPVAMVYRPLHTTAESRLERQPYRSLQRYVITWDGRLDNRDELMASLSTIIERSKTDVEIVAAAFHQWGTNCFSKIVGDWAVSIWDARDRVLTLARDYVGVKHLFYRHCEQTVSWCTHMSPLVRFGPQLTVCDEYVAGLLGIWPESHLTPYCEVHSVPSGHFVRIRDGQVTRHAYWTFDPRVQVAYKDDREYEEHFRLLFRQSVRRRLRSDYPILADLSGGLDSSSIVFMIDDVLAEQGKDPSAVDTFSVWDPDEPGNDDLEYLTHVEEKRKRRGYHGELKSVGDTFHFEYPTFIDAPDMSEREEVKAYKSTVLKNGGYRVVISGAGGDQVLGRDRDPRVQMADCISRFEWVHLSRLLHSWSLYTRRPCFQLLYQSLLVLLPTSVRAWMKPATEPAPWLNPRFARRYRIAESFLPACKGSMFWLPSVREAFQMFQSLAGLMTVLTPSTVDVRYPYLDQTLTEFLLSIPVHQLLRPGERRSLQRRALVNIVPNKILWRETKASAGRCNVLCLNKHWEIVERMLSSPVISRLGYIRKELFATALVALKSGQTPRRVAQLFKAIYLEIWLRNAATWGAISVPTPAASQQGEARSGHECRNSD